MKKDWKNRNFPTAYFNWFCFLPEIHQILSDNSTCWQQWKTVFHFEIFILLTFRIIKIEKREKSSAIICFKITFQLERKKNENEDVSLSSSNANEFASNNKIALESLKIHVLLKETVSEEHFQVKSWERWVFIFTFKKIT